MEAFDRISSLLQNILELPVYLISVLQSLYYHTHMRIKLGSRTSGRTREYETTVCCH